MNVCVVAPVCGWHSGAVPVCWDTWMSPDLRWACPRSRVTFDPIQVLQWAWHEVKGEAMAAKANEADYTGGIVSTVGLEERQ